MKVADFFCGAGGFSEGFRQAGFEVVFAIDKWAPAVQTYIGNKPTVKVVQEDILKVADLPDEEFHRLIPNTEIIIGSPPCVAFSSSNKSGNGDKELGIKLLMAYLKIVARKKFMVGSVLKYWILENVPNVRQYLKVEYSLSELGIDSQDVLTVIGEGASMYNAKYFGAPSNRKRFLCGEFPRPIITHDDSTVVPMNRVLESLGLPLEDGRGLITDCNYPNLTLDQEELTDHYYEFIVSDFEWEKARRLKQDKGYMGRMAFPEDTTKPARTIMATMATSSRESMIIGMPDGRYRLPTVREIASLMSFPIDYRFYGKSKGIKYTLVGNAVPPKLSYALAVAIAKQEQLAVPEHYPRLHHDNSIPFYNLNWANIPPKRERPKRPRAKFKYHIPYMIIKSYRVELTNNYYDNSGPVISWAARIHRGQGKDKAKIYTPTLSLQHIPFNYHESINEAIARLGDLVSSAWELQVRYCMTKADLKGLMGPYELLSHLKAFLERHFADSLELDISEEPYRLPVKIYVGYFMLRKIIEYGGRNDER